MCPPYTSHQPPAILHTAPTPMHPLRARLHCHIGTCPSIHVSHCLEELSPQTIPSGISYSMVGNLLCAHHLPSTSGNTPHCTCTCTPAPSPAALPHLDMPVQPCFPLPGGIFTTNQP